MGHDGPTKAKVLDITRGTSVLLDDVIFELEDGSRVRLMLKHKDAILIIGDEGYLTYSGTNFKGWTPIPRS